MPQILPPPTLSHSCRRMAARASLRATSRLEQEETEMIHVLAMITAKPGKRDEILAAFRANMPAVHAEAGCIEYGPAIDTEDAGRLQTPFGSETSVVVE